MPALGVAARTGEASLAHLQLTRLCGGVPNRPRSRSWPVARGLGTRAANHSIALKGRAPTLATMTAMHSRPGAAKDHEVFSCPPRQLVGVSLCLWSAGTVFRVPFLPLASRTGVTKGTEAVHSNLSASQRQRLERWSASSATSGLRAGGGCGLLPAPWTTDHLIIQAPGPDHTCPAVLTCEHNCRNNALCLGGGWGKLRQRPRPRACVAF